MKKTTVIDLSGGNQHIRDIAEESGMEWLSYRSSEETSVHSGHTVESWYDEDASSGWDAWKAWIKGVGTRSGPSREDAIANAVRKAEAWD
jgi:hypothetical protein